MPQLLWRPARVRLGIATLTPKSRPTALKMTACEKLVQLLVLLGTLLRLSDGIACGARPAIQVKLAAKRRCSVSQSLAMHRRLPCGPLMQRLKLLISSLSCLVLQRLMQLRLRLSLKRLLFLLWLQVQAETLRVL